LIKYQWIGREGPMSWPPRLSDLSYLDFFSFEAKFKKLFMFLWIINSSTTKENMMLKIRQMLNNFKKRITKCA